MNRYLDALEIVAFDLKTDSHNLGNLNNCDLLIIAMRPNNAQLEQLFYKITDSIKLIKPQLSYKTLLLENDCDQKINEMTQQNNFDRLVVFGAIGNIENIIHSGQFASHNILYGNNLEDLQQDTVLKKQLWSNLQAFLSK